jgi:hypothetical protein
MPIASFQGITPQGPTYFLTAALSSPTAVQIASGYSGYMMYSTAGNPVWFGYGTTSAQAIANAVIPTVGNPQNSVLLLPGYMYFYSLQPNLYFAALTTVSTAPVYIQSVI